MLTFLVLFDYIFKKIVYLIIESRKCNMLKRILSAIFLILIAIPLIVTGGKVFAIALGIIGIFALKEMLDLKTNQNSIPFFMKSIFYLGFLSVIYLIPFDYLNPFGIDYRLLVFLFFLYLLPTLYYHHKKMYFTKDAFSFLAITLFLGFACHGVIVLRMYNIWLFLSIILIPILTDTFALFFGRLIGKHKLSPNISPNKTWEGSICGSICATIISSGFYYLTMNPTQLEIQIFFFFLLSIVSQMGDLFFSTIKRENGVKDFSNLIPEHGGILDRFDSIIFTVLAFVLFISYF